MWHGRKLSFDETYEEVVADSFEAILADGNVVQLMEDMRARDKTLWEKVRDWFKDLAQKLQAAVDAFWSVEPDSVEGKLVSEMQDMIVILESFFTDALMDAGENYAASAQKNTAEGGVRYSLLVKRTNGEGVVVALENISRTDVLNHLEMSRKGLLESNTYFPVSTHTPSTLIATLRNAEIEVIDKPLAMQARKARQS